MTCPQCGQRMFRRGIIHECPGCSYAIRTVPSKRRQRKPQPVDELAEKASQRVELPIATEQLPVDVELAPPLEMATERKWVVHGFAICFVLGGFMDFFHYRVMVSFDYDVWNLIYVVCGNIGLLMLGCLLVLYSAFVVPRYVLSAWVGISLLVVLILLACTPFGVLAQMISQPSWAGWVLLLTHLLCLLWLASYLWRERVLMGW